MTPAQAAPFLRVDKGPQGSAFSMSPGRSLATWSMAIMRPAARATQGWSSCPALGRSRTYKNGASRTLSRKQPGKASQVGESHSRKPRASRSYPVAGHKERPRGCSLTCLGPGIQGRAAPGRGETPSVTEEGSRNLRLGKQS